MVNKDFHIDLHIVWQKWLFSYTNGKCGRAKQTQSPRSQHDFLISTPLQSHPGTPGLHTQYSNRLNAVITNVEKKTAGGKRRWRSEITECRLC